MHTTSKIADKADVSPVQLHPAGATLELDHATGPSAPTFPMRVAIDAAARPLAEKRLAKLAKDAATCGASLTWTFGPEYVVALPRRSDVGAVRHVRRTDLVVDGDPAPRIDGHTFVGTLDHAAIRGSVVVRDVPGQSVPERYFDAPATCDHCATRRRRSTTIVMRTDDGEHIAIGKSCMRHYFGHDVAGAVRLIDRVAAIGGWGEDEAMHGGRAHPEYDTREVLVAAVAVVRVEGFLSRAAAGEGGKSSADKVWELFEPPTFFGRYAEQEAREWKAWAESVEPTEADDVEAGAAIEWLGTQGSDSGYLHNLHAIAGAASIGRRLFGYWVSLASAHRKALGRARDAAREAAGREDEHVGTVGKRDTFDVEVRRITVVEGHYGTTTIVAMADEQGRDLVWFASNGAPDIDEGDRITIKATPKRHEQRGGRKQTVLARVAKVAETA